MEIFSRKEKLTIYASVLVVLSFMCAFAVAYPGDVNFGAGGNYIDDSLTVTGNVSGANLTMNAGAYTYLIRTTATGYEAINASGFLKWSSTNASYVFNTAIQALPNNVGGVIAIDNGQYTLTQQIIIDKNMVKFEGAGYGSSTPSANGTYFVAQGNINDHIIEVTGTYPELRGFTIYANGSQQSTGYALYLSSTDAIIENCAFFYGKTGNLFIYNSLAARIHNVYCEYSTSGVGIRFQGSNECNLDQIDVYGNYQGGLFIYGDCKRNQFHNIRFERCYTAGAYGLKVRNSGSSVPQYNFFSDCTFNGNAQYGITLEGAAYNTFTACMVYDNSQQTNNTYAGIIFQAGESSINTQGNIFVGVSVISTKTVLANYYNGNVQSYGFYEADANQVGNIISVGQSLGNGVANILTQGATTQIHSIYNGTVWVT